jgi:hypothetical protein
MTFETGMVAYPREGKTYSLYGSDLDTNAYYRRIHTFADDLLKQNGDLAHLLNLVRNTGKSKRRLMKIISRVPGGSTDSKLVHTLGEIFSQYTSNVASHLSGLSFAQRWDRTLSTSREQYHLAMLEVELVNRLNLPHFRNCDTRLAFLPHCLRDLAADCQRAPRGEDHMCKGCSTNCMINATSKLLRRHGVTPYIWITANLRSLFTRLRKQGKRVGVFGVACLPELVRGMRLCMRAGVPVTGIPLDANRCARWWGDFHPNTVNMQEIEKLLGDGNKTRPQARVTPQSTSNPSAVRTDS